MAAGDALKRVQKNDSTMANTLPSAQELKGYDHCCGIHGAARERKGIKNGTSAARRRHDKAVIDRSIQED